MRITPAVAAACAAGGYLYSIRHFQTLLDGARSSALAQAEIYEYYPTITELRVAAPLFAVGFLLFTLMLKVAVSITLGEFELRPRPSPEQFPNLVEAV